MNSAFARTLLKLTRPDRVRLFHEMVHDQWLPSEQLADLSRTRLTAILRHAAVNVPRYREFCALAGMDPSSLGHEDLARFPLISKQDMMEDATPFISTIAAKDDIVPNATGGSSGTWFQFFIDRGSMEIRLASDLRGRTWTGWRLGDKQAVLWGHPRDNKVSHSLRGKLLGYFVHRSRNMNAYNMDDGVIASYYKELRTFKPDMILGYSSALSFLADYLTREDLVLASPKGIISSAETLTDEHRSSIEGYFGCALLNRYGSREFANVAQQCEEVAGLHIFSDRVHVEILRPDGTPCETGERGEIVITDLDNTVMPFIRYRTGDLARTASGICSCGRGFPLLESVEGRTSELIVGKNGKYYSCQSPRLFGADIPGIGQMQLIQETIDLIEIKVVPDNLWNDDGREKLVARMTELLGDTEVKVTLVDNIPPAPSGKFPFTISKVSPFSS